MGKAKLGLSFEIMVPDAKAASRPPFSVPDWPEQLRVEGNHDGPLPRASNRQRVTFEPVAVEYDRLHQRFGKYRDPTQH